MGFFPSFVLLFIVDLPMISRRGGRIWQVGNITRLALLHSRRLLPCLQNSFSLIHPRSNGPRVRVDSCPSTPMTFPDSHAGLQARFLAMVQGPEEHHDVIKVAQKRKRGDNHSYENTATTTATRTITTATILAKPEAVTTIMTKKKSLKNTRGSV